MKALIMELSGGRAILLMPGGEMRTVRARRGWQVGQEIDVAGLTAKPVRAVLSFRVRDAVYPALACAAIVLVLFMGFDRLLVMRPDRTHEPLQPGATDFSPAPVSTATPEPTEVPTEVPAPDPTEVPTEEPTEAPTGAPEQTAVPCPPVYDDDDDDDDDDGDDDDDDDDDDDSRHHGEKHHGNH